MAINPESQYPGKITPSSSAYPYGQARNITVPGDGTGTPWEAALVNDIFGFQQALLDRAGIVPSGDPDSVLDSQYLTALEKIAGTTVGDYAALRALKSTGLSDGQSIFVSDDGVAGRFVVKTGTVTDNGGTLLVFTDDSNRYAERLYNRNAVSLLWFGADKTGGTYINTAWVAAMEVFSDGLGGRLIVPDGTYLVEPTYRVAGDLDKQLDYPYDNVTVQLDGTLQVDTHSNRYIILLMGRRRGSTSTTPNPVKNIALVGKGKIRGDRNTHSPLDTNFGFGLYPANCENWYVEGITIEDVYGDNFYLDALPYGPADGDNNNNSLAKRGNVVGVVCKNAYRNNYTNINLEHVDYWGCHGIGANGAAPQAGFNVEPEYYDLATEFYCKGIRVHGGSFTDNEGSGMEIVDTSEGIIEDFIVDGAHVENNGSPSNGFGGIRLVNIDGGGGSRVVNCNVVSNYGSGIEIDGVGSGTTNSHTRTLVSGNFITGTLEGTKEGTTLGHGLGVRNGVRNVVLSTNIVELSARQGIYVNGNGDGSTPAAGVDAVLLADNIVYANSQAADNTYDNVLVNTGCQNVSVDGGIIRRNHPKGGITNFPRWGLNLLEDECNAYNVDVIDAGATGNLTAPNAAIYEGDATRSGAVKNCKGYKNQNVIRSGVQNVDVLGTFSVGIAHGLDRTELSNASLQPLFLTQCTVQMLEEPGIVGSPVVVPRLVSIDATNVTVAFTVTTAGTTGDQMRVGVTIMPPGV